MQKEIGTIDLNDLLNDNAIDPIQYQYYKHLKDRKIIINDDITSNILEMAVLPLIEMDNDGSGKPIEIYLNTDGGSVYDGFTLVHAIESAKSPIIVRIFGTAASMGILIAMAGYKSDNVQVVCSPYSVGLIHSGSQYMSGSTHQIRDTFRFSERYSQIIKDYILSHTTIDEKMYDEIERQEFWMTADDMLKYGIVNKIV